VASFDQAGLGTASLLYPAPNAGGFLAALLTHGFLLEGSKNAQLEKIQQSANRVLAPYQAVISTFEHRDLMKRGLEKIAWGGTKMLIEFSEKPDTGLIVESVPLFSMTQDQTAIVLDNAIAIHGANAPATSAYKNIFRIVSEPQKRTDLVTYWTANDGENLKSESASLLAESLELAFRDLDGEPAAGIKPHRTVRYFEGTAEKMERGQIVSETCNRIVLRNLRGWLMAVPPRSAPGVATAACDGKPR
jgi:hypothetical protein